jgi:hypothetical protein
MPKTKLKQSNAVNLKPQELNRLFQISSELSDFIEDILEEQGQYSDDFIASLERSIKQAQQGRVRVLNSLRDLR